ncbi:hypothetical protein ACWDUL_20385 [Nocardia niigatensis]
MTAAPWVMIANYPHWPSPYFTQLAQALPRDGGYRFAASLAEIPRSASTPGVINLHRLSRLYWDVTGRPSAERAAVMAADLAELRRLGWRLVWTVHNLFPIHAGYRHPVDTRVAADILARADALIAHTQSDTESLRRLYETGPVVTCGSAGLDAIPAEPPTSQVQRLVRYLKAGSASLLVLGNLASYKGLPHLVRIFLDSTRSARLVMAGRPSDQQTAQQLARLASRSGGRVLVHPEPVAFGSARALCEAADALIAPYRTDGPYGMFRHVLHPSSVSMATGFGVPVVAPDLPSIRELTRGYPAALYGSAGHAASLLTRIDAGDPVWGEVRVRPVLKDRWASIAATYERLKAETRMREAQEWLP